MSRPFNSFTALGFLQIKEKQKSIKRFMNGDIQIHIKMASCQISAHTLKCFSLTASFEVPVEAATIKAHSLIQ